MVGFRNIELLFTSLILFALQCLFFSLAFPEISPSEKAPGARWGHVFIHNPAQQHILLFGGTDQRGGPYLDDTWIWKNGKWQDCG